MSTDERAKVLPTTQKEVLNTVYKLEFDTSDGSNGYRYLSMDNCYECPECNVPVVYSTYGDSQYEYVGVKH